MRHDLWIIEARKEDGSLDFSGPDPASVFGMGAITGMTDDQMAKVVFRHIPDVDGLDGREIASWPSKINPCWVARRKTW